MLGLNGILWDYCQVVLCPADAITNIELAGKCKEHSF